MNILKIELEPGNSDVRSLVVIEETKRVIRLVFKDCEETITWRFKDKSISQITESIRKAERVITVLECLQNNLKEKLIKQ